jgi:hypothetical protein
MTTHPINSAATKRPEKTPAQRARDAAGKQTSVFDRLHKTSTASSKSRKTLGPVVQKSFLDDRRNGNTKESVDRRKKTVNTTTRCKNGTAPSSESVYSRLYGKGTASSVSKRVSTPTKAPSSAQTSRAVLKPKNHL